MSTIEKDVLGRTELEDAGAKSNGSGRALISAPSGVTADLDLRFRDDRGLPVDRRDGCNEVTGLRLKVHTTSTTFMVTI